MGRNPRPPRVPGVRVKTVAELRLFIQDLEDDLEVVGFYDDRFGIGGVWLEADEHTLDVDVERVSGDEFQEFRTPSA